MTKSLSLGIYLGAFLSSYKLLMDYTNIMQKNEDRINSWHTSYLSKASREVLIQSNLEALSVYICSSFLLPTKTCKQLDIIHKIYPETKFPLHFAPHDFLD